MALATWWPGDALPQLAPLTEFSAGPTGNEQLLAQLTGLTPAEIQHRQAAGHQPYLGYLAGEPVAYGWVATRQAGIGELGLSFNIPPLHRYLWDFATLPQWRGRGIYPHLLQTILRQEMNRINFFWIIYAPENHPSGSGIYKAGFTTVGQLSIHKTGGVGLTPLGERERALTGAALLAVPLRESGLSPCWYCGGAAYPASLAAAACICHSLREPVQATRETSCPCVAA
jgi:ribosomal protein S18 acetylase RimI-like enzyme